MVPEMGILYYRPNSVLFHLSTSRVIPMTSEGLILDLISVSGCGVTIRVFAVGKTQSGGGRN